MRLALWLLRTLVNTKANGSQMTDAIIQIAKTIEPAARGCVETRLRKRPTKT